MKKGNIILELGKIVVFVGMAWFIWLIIFAIFTTTGDEAIGDFYGKLAFILGILTGIVMTIIIKYNSVNRLKQKVKESYSNISVYKEKSKKLLEKANKVSDKYMKHEKDVQVEVTNLRKIKSANEFQATIENYPELKANESIMKLLYQIEDTENSIANTKVIYNNHVSEYNTAIHNFPVSLIRGLFKIKDMEFYSEDDIVSDEELGI